MGLLAFSKGLFTRHFSRHIHTHTGLTLRYALHEFVIGLIVLWTDMVTHATELV